jgi:hypothetical protein
VGQLPSFLIIGAPKCATTSLFRYLDTHPDVFMAPAKELRFFDARFDRGVDWYAAQFAGASGERAAGEATPMYLADPNAGSRIAEILPDAKLIAVLRHPVERAYSQYWHRKLRSGEERSFGELVDDELNPHGVDESRPFSHIIDIGRYARHLQRFATYVDRGELQLFSFEDLRDEPVATFASVCRFLGVDDTHVPPNLGQTYNRPHRVRSRRVREAMLRRKLPTRAPRLARWLDGLLRDEQEYPPMDPGARAVLLDTYRDDNARLAALWKRDLSDWDE